MYEGQNSFDFDAAERARDIGIAEAYESKKELVEYARKLAVRIAERTQSPISMDDVQYALECEGISVFALGNSAGGLFERKKWKPVGRVRSAREHSHGNWLTTWKLKNG